ncbi:UNVERIFIED_CONTAM: Pentatricopeptide repeat-containing protein, mitochondrial [Sesamum indicum]
MFGIHQSANRFLHTVSFFTRLVDQCFSVTNPSNSLKLIHAQLIKLGLSSNTFLGNRCIDLYLKSGSAIDALKAFHDLPGKNIVSWNLYLKVCYKCFGVEKARLVFDRMPERDVVSWNTIISGYISSGFLDRAWELFLEMRDSCVRPSEFTFSMLLCCVKCGNYAKEIHGCIVRLGGGYSNLVVGNSLIDVYGKLGLVDYSLAVFLSMEKVDVVSWNSMISGVSKVDEHTISAVLNACTNLRNLEKGKQVFCLCIKLGFLSNTVVSSAAIDLFSKCNRMENAISVFKESYLFDSAICNSMIACYASHNFEAKALELFVFSFSESIRPTEFALSCVLCSAAVFVSVEQGSQLHSLVIKAGFEADNVVATSLVHMYSKYGLIDLALKVSADMDSWDLISWNTMILALTQNGKPVEAICLFEELLQSGLRPDRINICWRSFSLQLWWVS